MTKFVLRRIIAVCITMVLLLCLFLQIADASDLDKIKKAIKEKKAALLKVAQYYGDLLSE